MKFFLTTLAAVLAFGSSACSQRNTASGKESEATPAGAKTAIVYFSATGTTKAVAERLAVLTKADIIEITPAKNYSDADLDWTDKNSRSSVEMADTSSRPEITNASDEAAGYNVIFIGFPIWWDLAPTVVNTWIESAGLDNKTVVPFATSGGSSISNSVSKLKMSYPSINWKEGRLLNNASDKEIGRWIDTIGI